ncbi:MAG: 3-deoxy-8-phosphooctulonate synthase [Acidobacteria bacterium]|nr:MAG: 3-deoxy-8-phosphooctulonate synthase [Acidobacteriota bacterium]REK11708.1 MAG: 3-deoxy-8-phosphooctulonate synthase [Acidobacteriota bacterium]
MATGIGFGDGGFPVIAGPCVIEGERWLVEWAGALRQLARECGTEIVFKSSFDKANRSSLGSFRGPGLEQGLAALAAVKQAHGLPLLTDVHEPSQCAAAAEVCDVLQIPAFLCRQTDLLLAAGETGRPVMIKKGQFVAPSDMLRAVDKVRSTGNERVAVTERGVSFGYHNLVVDMRSFSLLHEEGVFVLYDVTHSLQLPGALGHQTGGDRRFARALARGAVAAGADGLYLETHPDPSAARCDDATQLPPETTRQVLADALALRRLFAAEGRPVEAGR